HPIKCNRCPLTCEDREQVRSYKNDGWLYACVLGLYFVLRRKIQERGKLVAASSQSQSIITL
ncbi:hypothetical protein BGW80DRAFT_1208773, partial [Lactifluus volemus]